MALGRWPHVRVTAARPRAGSLSAIAVVGHVRRPGALSLCAWLQWRSSLPVWLLTPSHCSHSPAADCLPRPWGPPRRQPSMRHSRPRLHLPEHHRALGYLAHLSILTDECPSDPSPEPYLPLSSPLPRAHIGEPPSIQNPKLGPPPLGHVSRQPLLRPRLLAGQILPVSHRCQGGGKRLPCLSLGLKGPMGWSVTARQACGQMGLAHSNSKISYFSFRNYSIPIQFKSKLVKFLGT
jgi:hypothetical protein